jgi:hypothetical protein
MADDQPGEWLNYEQAAELLGVSPEAARQKAIRGRWPRARGDDGKARLRLPEGRRTPFAARRTRPKINQASGSPTNRRPNCSAFRPRLPVRKPFAVAGNGCAAMTERPVYGSLTEVRTLFAPGRNALEEIEVSRNRPLRPLCAYQVPQTSTAFLIVRSQ